MARRKFSKKALASVRKAAKALKLENEEEELEENNNVKTKLTWQQRNEIRNSVAEKRIKVIWNFNPGDLVIIKSKYSSTGSDVIGLVTWGQKEVQQRKPIYNNKSLSSYNGSIRVMSVIGYNFYQPQALERL